MSARRLCCKTSSSAKPTFKSSSNTRTSSASFNSPSSSSMRLSSTFCCSNTCRAIHTKAAASPIWPKRFVTQRFTPGTSAYMPPEGILTPQHFGLKELDARSDIYALGISLYEMLCGHLPFTPDEGTNPEASIRRKQVEQMPLPPSIVNPNVPRPLD